ncbi:MAG: hypothetical protein HY372_02560 [Candidatus Andersenbacteria bacterium]|nr:hypothetical protein [Candidatus Andersenbacteria bacterium]
MTAALIESRVRHLLTLMGFSDLPINCTWHTGAAPSPVRQQLTIAITAGAAGRLLIGTRGTHLQALQHIVRALLKRALPESPLVTVDVNSYWSSREQTLLRLAEEAARKAGHTGQAIVLPPMAAGERRTIHTSLAARPDVNTASLGTEPNRRVVVRPVFT